MAEWWQEKSEGWGTKVTGDAQDRLRRAAIAGIVPSGPEFPADASLEDELHQEYAEFRVRGEWFRLSGAQIEEIKRRTVAVQL